MSRAVLLLAATVLAGCVDAPRRVVSPPVSVPHLPNYPSILLVGKASSELVKTVECALAKMPVKIANAIDSVNFSGNPDHFSDGEIAHMEPRGRICFNVGILLEESTVWHEAAHAFEATLPDKFRDEWIRIAGDVYQGDNWRSFKYNYSKYHVLSGYALKNFHEDIAVFVEKSYQYTYGYYGGIITVSDPVILKKVEFLRKYGFYTDEVWNKINSLR